MGISRSEACGNEYGYTVKGEILHSHYFYLTKSMRTFKVEYINENIQELEAKIKNNTANFETLSDLSWNYIKLGKIEKGYHILDSLIKHHPKEYNVISNLGTAYELKGELDSALKYISLGININSKSHRGSEWIHVKILEAKIKRKQNPNYIRENSILSLDNLISEGNDRKTIDKINYQLIYQIRTRAPFTPSPNEVITNLLITLGDYNREIGTYENAFLAYANAIDYTNNKSIKRSIYEKIKTLNSSRFKDLKKNKDSESFYRKVKLYNINPELLILDNFNIEDINSSASTMDINEILKEKEDSISYLKNNNTRLLATYSKNIAVIKEKVKTLKSKKKKETYFTLFYILIGSIFGYILHLSIKKFNK